MTWRGASGVTCPNCSGRVCSTNDACLCCELCGHRWSAETKTPVPSGQAPAPTLHCTCGKAHTFTAPVVSGSCTMCTKCVTDWELIDNIMGGQMWVMKMSNGITFDPHGTGFRDGFRRVITAIEAWRLLNPMTRLVRVANKRQQYMSTALTSIPPVAQETS